MILDNEFYILEETYTNFADVVALENDYDIWECPKCESVFVKRLSDFKVCFKGKKIGDYYSASNYNIISKNLQEVLKEAKITGFNLRNIDVEGWYDSRGKKLDIDYSGLKEIVIKGRCGDLRHKDGRLLEKCNECGAKDYTKQDEVNGLSVNIDEWDKSEMFYFKNWEGVIIVTERVKEVIEKDKFKNINFVNIKDFKFD